jgi:WD40 repeat protein
VFTAPASWEKTVDWSPDGSLIATGSFNRGPIIWDFDSGEPAWGTFGKTHGINALVADGVIGIVAGADSGVLSIFSKGWTGDPQEIPVCSYPVIGLALHPDKSRLAVGCWDGSISILRTVDWTLVWTKRQHNGPVNCVAWSPDGEVLATGGYDETIRVTSTDGETIGQLVGHTGAIKSVSWSPDGRLLASGARYDPIFIWDVQELSLERVLDGEHAAITNCVAWSPSGEQIAVCGKNSLIEIWSCKGWVRSRVLKGHQASVKTIAWSASEEQIVSGSYDKTSRLWNLARVSEVFKTSNLAGVSAVAWLSENSYAFGLWNGEIKIVDCESNEVKSILAER